MLKSLAKLKKGGPPPTDADVLKKFYKKAAAFGLDKDASAKSQKRKRRRQRKLRKKRQAQAAAQSVVDTASSAPKPPPVPDASPKKLLGMSKTKKGLLALAGTTLLAAGGKHLYDKKQEQKKEAGMLRDYADALIGTKAHKAIVDDPAQAIELAKQRDLARLGTALGLTGGVGIGAGGMALANKEAAAFSKSEYDKTINWYKGQMKKHPNNKAMRKDYEMLVSKKKQLVKSASVSELSTLASLVEQGQMGKEAQYAFEGMTQAIDRYVEEDLTEKTASHAETDYTIYDENAARIARLDNLLRKL